MNYANLYLIGCLFFTSYLIGWGLGMAIITSVEWLHGKVTGYLHRNCTSTTQLHAGEMVLPKRSKP